LPVELEMALRTVPPLRTDQELLAQCGHVPWGGDHGATGFCKQPVAMDSHRTMPPARQAHVECGFASRGAHANLAYSGSVFPVASTRKKSGPMCGTIICSRTFAIRTEKYASLTRSATTDIRGCCAPARLARVPAMIQLRKLNCPQRALHNPSRAIRFFSRLSQIPCSSGLAR
jgi:hypothetical protein